MYTQDLFGDDKTATQIGPQAWHLPGFLKGHERQLWQWVQTVAQQAPWRQLTTPGGRQMSVQTTNCGTYGWYSDTQGYRYINDDPLTQNPWPPLPQWVKVLARDAAQQSGFAAFEPNACLLNLYSAGTRMGLHQDKDERDFEQPIVSFSLGLSANFLWGGMRRLDKYEKVMLRHGDAVVWGGVDRLRYHGIATVKANEHPMLGAHRLNLTLRRAD